MGPSDVLAVLDAVHCATGKRDAPAPIASLDLPFASLQFAERRDLIVLIDGYAALTSRGECERNRLRGTQWRRIGPVEAAVLDESEVVRAAAAALDLLAEPATVYEIAKKAGYSECYVGDAVRSLVDRGLAERAPRRLREPWRYAAAAVRA